MTELLFKILCNRIEFRTKEALSANQFSMKIPLHQRVSVRGIKIMKEENDKATYKFCLQIHSKDFATQA